jgi:isoquinoline 1-oxidoreductase subunit beta
MARSVAVWHDFVLRPSMSTVHAAQKLDADFDSVRVVNAANGAEPNGDVYGNPDLGSAFQLTGASNSMKGLWVRYRLAAARARARLVAAAAEAWQVPADEVEVEDGFLRHESGKRATFAELSAQAEQLPVPDGVQPKDSADYKLIGREGRLRVDAVPKILGTTHFTIDQSLPGMLTAVVLHPPRFGATVAAVDDRAALAEAGVTAVVPIAEVSRSSPRPSPTRSVDSVLWRWSGTIRTPSGGAPQSCSQSTSGCSSRARTP